MRSSSRHARDFRDAAENGQHSTRQQGIALKGALIASPRAEAETRMMPRGASNSVVEDQALSDLSAVMRGRGASSE